MILLPRNCTVVVARVLVGVVRTRTTPRLALPLPEPTSLAGRPAIEAQGRGERDTYSTMVTHQQPHQVSWENFKQVSVITKTDYTIMKVQKVTHRYLQSTTNPKINLMETILVPTLTYLHEPWTRQSQVVGWPG